MKKFALTIALALLLVPAAAFADSLVDFSVTGGNGTWSWNGIGTPLSANSGPLNNIYATPTNPLDTVWLVFLNSPPQLSLTSGTAIAPTGPFQLADFLPGGTVAISQDLTPYCTDGPCFSGTFTGAQILNTGNGYAFDAQFVTGQVDPGLLAALGLPTTPTEYAGGITVQLRLADGVTLDANGCHTSNVTFDTVGAAPVVCGGFGSADMDLHAVPEPGTLTLLGTGLLGMAGFLRRKLRKS